MLFKIEADFFYVLKFSERIIKRFFNFGKDNFRQILQVELSLKSNQPQIF